MNRKLIRIRSVLDRVPYSKPSLYRLIKDGSFPAPIPLGDGGRAVAWIESEVDNWIEQQIEKKRGIAHQESAVVA